ncbi:MAG: hypothetical protein QM733_01120 [Ilumatobacteraceae bacterium]
MTFAAGYHAGDFKALGCEFSDRMGERYRRSLNELTSSLSGSGPLTGDGALAEWVACPGQLLSTANSPVGARRAADFGMGMVLSMREPVDRLRRSIDAFRSAGGDGPVHLTVGVWLGAPSAAAMAAVLGSYDAAAPPGSTRSDRGNPFVFGSVDEITNVLLGTLDSVGADAISMRLQALDSPDRMEEQVRRLGAELLPPLRQHPGLAGDDA